MRPFFYETDTRICDDTIGGTFIWRDYFNTRFVISDGVLYMEVDYPDGTTAFTYPAGGADDSLYAVRDYCSAKGIPLIFCMVTPQETEVLQRVFGELDIKHERDWYDYLYDAQQMKELSGRKFSAVRNHINKFKNQNTNWSFEKITPENIKEACDFINEHSFDSNKGASSFEEGERKNIEVLENYELYGMVGGILKVGDKIVGLSIGEIVRDTLFVHIEKADRNIPGAYQMLMNKFALEYAQGPVRYINREDDAGDEGLRKSKLAYQPISLLEKYTVRVV